MTSLNKVLCLVVKFEIMASYCNCNKLNNSCACIRDSQLTSFKKNDHVSNLIGFNEKYF